MLIVASCLIVFRNWLDHLATLDDTAFHFPYILHHVTHFESDRIDILAGTLELDSHQLKEVFLEFLLNGASYVDESAITTNEVARDGLAIVGCLVAPRSVPVNSFELVLRS